MHTLQTNVPPIARLNGGTAAVQDGHYICPTRSGALYFISIEPSQERGQSIITLEERPGFWAKFFGAKPRTVQYLGSGTVWYQLPNLRHAGTWLDTRLVEIWRRDRYQRATASSTTGYNNRGS